MDARELRIGNWVKFEDWYYQIESLAKELPTLDTPEFGIGVVDWNNLNPIPLTEEWLLKFSFSETEMRPYSDQKAFIIGRDADRIIFSAGRLFKPLPDDGFICICYHCEFAHQLQNAFFAYKNEELELKFTHENHYL